MDARDAWRLLADESPVWAIEPRALEAMAAALTTGAKLPARSRPAPRGGRTSIVPIIGPLTRRPGLLSRLLGTGDAGTYQGIERQVREAVADPSVDRLILLVDSPGGAAVGCEECADVIASAARVMPVVAFADGLMASAAYWLSAGANMIAASKSAEIGSIGVLAVHADVTRALEMMGVKPTVFRAKIGPLKAEGLFEPLSKDAAAFFQGQLDEMGETFGRAVARGRRVPLRTVRRDFGQGRVLLAREAHAAGMIDSINTFENAIATRGSDSRLRGARGAASRSSAPSRISSQERRRRLRLLELG